MRNTSNLWEAPLESRKKGVKWGQDKSHIELPQEFMGSLGIGKKALL